MILYNPFPLLLWFKSTFPIPLSYFRPHFRETLPRIVQEISTKSGKHWYCADDNAVWLYLRYSTTTSAVAIGCSNAQTPDLYGHYREARYSQTKHHWWWKVNFIFGKIRTLRHYDGKPIVDNEFHMTFPNTLYHWTQVQSFLWKKITMWQKIFYTYSGFNRNYLKEELNVISAIRRTFYRWDLIRNTLPIAKHRIWWFALIKWKKPIPITSLAWCRLNCYRGHQANITWAWHSIVQYGRAFRNAQKCFVLSTITTGIGVYFMLHKSVCLRYSANQPKGKPNRNSFWEP